MYFPYVRGRQYELLALRELAANDLLGSYVVPIVEPVKLSPTLIKTMSEYVRLNHPISVIRNPAVGSFMKDLKDAVDGTKEGAYKNDFYAQYEKDAIIKGITMQKNAQSLINHFGQNNVNKAEVLVVNIDREYLDLYDKEFEGVSPRYALIPDESAFRRKVRRNRVLLDDKFDKQSRNADYGKEDDKFFSDDHLYCIFRSDSATHSGHIRPLNPVTFGQRFR
jgi:hypothetical protein